MILGYHVIFGAYGFWLPNDPRGSWSTEVWAKHLRPFGRATKVETRRSLADASHDHTLRHAAKGQLKYPAVRFTAAQIDAVARGFTARVEGLKLPIHACAIMPDHVHLVVGRCQAEAEYLAGLLKRGASRQLAVEGLHPLAEHRVRDGRLPTAWAEDGWFVFLNTPVEMLGRIQYVEDNPVKEGLAPQRWPFVVPYRL